MVTSTLAAGETNMVRMKCRARSGRNADLQVLDISAGGAMVDCRGWSAAPGDRVLVTLPGLSAQPAELVWLEDDRAGIAFEQPLHDAVLVHLQRTLGC